MEEGTLEATAAGNSQQWWDMKSGHDSMISCMGYEDGGCQMMVMNGMRLMARRDLDLENRRRPIVCIQHGLNAFQQMHVSLEILPVLNNGMACMYHKIYVAFDISHSVVLCIGGAFLYPVRYASHESTNPTREASEDSMLAVCKSASINQKVLLMKT